MNKKWEKYEKEIKTVEEKAKKEVREIRKKMSGCFTNKYFANKDKDATRQIAIKTLGKDKDGDQEILVFDARIGEDKRVNFSLETSYFVNEEFKDAMKYFEEITKQEFNKVITDKIAELLLRGE